MPEPMTPEQLAENSANYRAEQRQRYNERQIRKNKRLEDGSLDPANKAKYGEKVKEWQSIQRDHIEANPQFKRHYDREQTRGLTAAPKSGIMSVGGGEVTVLPNIETAIIPIEKFTQYALDPVKSRGKAQAFESSLGYTLSNADRLMENIRQNIKNFKATDKGDNGYGIKYEVLMNLTGENGKTANIVTSWIKEHATGETRLPSAYITKRGLKND